MKSIAFASALVACADADQTYSKPTYGHGYSKDAASAAYGVDEGRKSSSDWDTYGRDQDLSISESYGATNAKSYMAESYDEWDNKDNDKWGAQAWE